MTPEQLKAKSIESRLTKLRRFVAKFEADKPDEILTSKSVKVAFSGIDAEMKDAEFSHEFASVIHGRALELIGELESELRAL